MQATLLRACAVAPKRLRRFAHAQNDLLCAAAVPAKSISRIAPNGGCGS
jgi:hypothetical protein